MATEKIELTFEGGHRVTVSTSNAGAWFLSLAAKERLPLVASQDYYDYYGLDKEHQE